VLGGHGCHTSQGPVVNEKETVAEWWLARENRRNSWERPASACEFRKVVILALWESTAL
jgi:hypothetical protein